MKKLILSIALAAMVGTILSGQNKLETALTLWKNGNITDADAMAKKVLEKDPYNNEAIYLQMKIMFVQGKYSKSIEEFFLLKESFEKYSDAADLSVKAYIHLRDYENAWKIADKNKLDRALYLKELKDKPFSVKADKTYIVSFLNDPQLPTSFWPGVNGTLNAKKASIRFDTGANFLVIGKGAAEKHGIQLKYEDKGMHGAAEVTTWRAIADSMSFENGPTFLNVPVVIVADIGNYIIFGTNILEQFLSTVDYYNDRFILTPRDKPNLFPEHSKLLPQNQKKIQFYLWQDHYMIAKGKFAGRDSLNFFFDSGLIAITQIDGKLAQASFAASREKLQQWGFDTTKMTKTTFFPTEYFLETAGLRQTNTLVHYDNKLIKDRNFGGIRIDGLISHAWLKNYSWTLDFDKMEFGFGVK